MGLSKLSAALAVCLTLAAGSAGATTFYFGVPEIETADGSLGHSVDGIDLMVSSSSGNIHMGRRGYGVGAKDSDGQRRLSGNESLTFAFSSTVSLIESVVLEVRDGNDLISIFVDGADEAATVLNASGSKTGLVTFTGLNLKGDKFEFQRTGGLGDTKSAGVRINSLTIATMPIPASLPLLAFAFGGLAYTARRRKQRTL